MGSDTASNLCLCCLRCNLKKGPNIPRRQQYDLTREANVARLYADTQPQVVVHLAAGLQTYEWAWRALLADELALGTLFGL
jgi:hypothetical protein